MEESILIKLLGDYPVIRVFNFLLIFREFDYSFKDIAKESKTNFVAFQQLLPHFEQLAIITVASKVNNIKRYKLNTENSLVRDLIQFVDSLVWNYTDREILKS